MKKIAFALILLSLSDINYLDAYKKINPSIKHANIINSVVQTIFNTLNKPKSEYTLYEKELLNAFHIINDQTLKLRLEDINNLGNFRARYNESSKQIIENIDNTHKELDKLYNLNNLESFILIDLLYLINEIYRIKTVTSDNSSKIITHVSIGAIFNILSIIYGFTNTLNQNDLIHKFAGINYKDKRIEPISIIIKWALFSRILPAIAAVEFILKDIKIIKDTKDTNELAKTNTKLNSNIKDFKTKQLIWLMINKITPYIAMAVLGSGYKQAESVKKQNNFTGQVFIVIKAISDISEIIRKHYRYKVEIGNCQNHKTNNN
ncbi:MAG: hypothetical protein M0R03_16635 [Novosphingobium sp.]|nr:hypothetical protein [Novosphingobium sp.]